MDPLRKLPSVDQVLRNLKQVNGLPRELLANEVRSVLAERRDAAKTGKEIAETSVEVEVELRVDALLQRSLRPVINATGVILHTNLGRAPVADFHPIPRYSNLEYDLASGRRGKRDVHTARLLECLLGKPAVLVNNNAAAVFLVLHELACGREVIVSRGELIEIGDGFRIPEIMARSGALLREVGTTNRTRLEDYKNALTDKTGLILRVHPSNFRVTGFTARPEVKELVELARESGIPLYEDLGSGCLVDLRAKGIDEPLVAESLNAGVNLVSFSCDKLLGGPQSGIIAGDRELVQPVRRNPMYRALRADKLIIEALENTLGHLVRHAWQAIPTLQMIFEGLDEVKGRAERVANALAGFTCEVVQTKTAIGGGSTPDQTLPSWAVQLTVPNAPAFEGSLRGAAVPVIARIEHNRIILDMRTVADEEEAMLIAAVQHAGK